MRPRQFDETLDQCLSMMQAGVSVEDCVVRNPEHAEELRAQLRIAQTLLDARPDVQPEPSAQARGRARLLAAAAEARKATSSTPAPALLAPLGTLFGGVRRLALLPQAIPAVLVLLILGGTALGFAAATGSPDPTAPFRQLVPHSRQERVELRGTITAIELTTLTIATPQGDVTVHTSEKTKFEDKDGTSLTLTDFQVGDFVKISAFKSDDGMLLAREVEREEGSAEEQPIQQDEADEDRSGPDSPGSGPSDDTDHGDTGDDGDSSGPGDDTDHSDIGDDGDSSGPGDDTDHSDIGDDEHFSDSTDDSGQAEDHGDNSGPSDDTDHSDTGDDGDSSGPGDDTDHGDTGDGEHHSDSTDDSGQVEDHGDNSGPSDDTDHSDTGDDEDHSGSGTSGDKSDDTDNR